MQIITSRQNSLVVETAKLQDKKYRRQKKRFFLEGEKLFLEALKSQVEVEYAMMTEGPYARLCPRENTYPFPVYCVGDSVFEKISTEKAPQGILTVVKDLDILHKRYIIYSSDSQSSVRRCFLLCGIQDPGNLGTMIRSANAFGIDELILSGDCADLYHPRTVRAAMGALFRQRICICTDVPASIAVLRQQGYTVYAATLNGDSRPLPQICAGAHTCFAVGNEGHGLPQQIIDACDGSVIIPMQPDTESLNAATAAAILMWETVRNQT